MRGWDCDDPELADDVSTAPLEDPAYDPKVKPVNGAPPDIVAKWGARSQIRWFDRFRDELKPQKVEVWNRFYVGSEQHRGGCCPSCDDDRMIGDYTLDDECCCYAIKS